MGAEKTAQADTLDIEITEDIEITDEMVQAGAEELLNSGWVEEMHPDFAEHVVEDILKKIFPYSKRSPLQ